MIKLLKKLKDIIDPNYWATKIGEKSGLYDKAEKSSIRKWALGLTGWKWWAWQIVGGITFVLIVEFFLNKVGLTMLPWK
tara:strand:- start:417 stop:653 length:237 start_codon:yes stop_codon:yes gene_type:complete